MSEIRATTISDTAGTGPVTLTGQSAAKSWINFNATGTVAARDSFNVSSITDVNVSKKAVNFSSAFAAADYAAVATGGEGTNTGTFVLIRTPGDGVDQAADSITLVCTTTSAGYEPKYVHNICHGDLA